MTVRSIFRHCYLVIHVGLIVVLRRWYRWILFLSLVSLCEKRMEGYVRCRCWDRPFSLSSLLSLSTLCWADYCVTMLVPPESIFILCTFLVSSWQEARRVVAALLLISPFSLLSSWQFVQQGSLRRPHCYRKFSPFLLLSSFYFMKRWLVRRCRCYRQFSLLFSCRFVSTIYT